MKKLNLKLLLCSVFLNAFATASSAQTAKEMDLKDFSYVSTISGTTWKISFEDKSKYTSSGIPETRVGEVLIEGQKKNGSSIVKKISIPNFPNEDGFFILSLQSLDQPLFLLISKGGELADTQRRVHLISHLCSKPIAYFDASMEETSDIQVSASANDFKVSYESISGQKTEKVWVKPEASQSLCSHGFR